MRAADEIYIVIVTLNRWQDTRACLDTVYSRSGSDVRVLVIDNGSTDETPNAIRDTFPQAALITTGTNLGYAQGNNLGIQLAKERGAEFVVLLNNDVVVGENWLTPLLNAAREDPQAALLGPLVYHADEATVIQSAGGVLTPDWRSSHRGENEYDRGQYQHVEPVDWLTGCTILARCAALDTIGLLDPAFYMYGEDVDWCVRATRAGYRVMFVPQSCVWHKGVRRDYAPAPYVTYYSARNELQMIQKHRGGTMTLARTFARHARTVSSWTLKPRWREQRAHRDALARALFDFARGNFGQAQGLPKD